MTIAFRPIDRPWLYGQTASFGARRADVVLAVSDGDLWLCFTYVNNRHVKGRCLYLSHADALREARAFLRSKSAVETW